MPLGQSRQVVSYIGATYISWEQVDIWSTDIVVTNIILKNIL